VPNYKKFNNFKTQVKETEYRRHENRTSASTIEGKPNYIKEQGKGNFNGKSNAIYKLLLEIKKNISSMKEEQETIKQRITTIKRNN